MPTHFATKPKRLLTAYQFEVLRLIVKGNPETDDPWDFNLDIDQLIERIKPKETTKQALQFVVRALVTNGMIIKLSKVKRRNRLRVTYAATDVGKSVAGEQKQAAAFLEPEPGSIEELLEDFKPEAFL